MFDSCLYFNTSALARQLEREWTKAFSVFDLTAPQGFALRAVIDVPGLLQHEIAEALSIARSTATRVLDGLASKGLIERRVSDRDGREFHIYPTQAALEVREALNAASGQITKRLKKLLGEDVFVDTVTKVRGVRSALN
jgi:MarR family transcriptional regulator, temperature-dependent positive regulator of motility